MLNKTQIATININNIMNDTKISNLMHAGPLSGNEFIPVDQYYGSSDVLTTVRTTPEAIRDYIKATADFVPTGSIMPYAGAAAPAGWLLCNGSSVSRYTYKRLFQVIGTTYGNTDSIMFKLPNLVGRVIVGHSASSNYTPAFGNWSTNDTFKVGASGGEFYHRLIVDEIPAHNHNLQDPGHTHSVYDPRKSTGEGVRGGDGNGSRKWVPVRYPAHNQEVGVSTTGITIDNVGGNLTHNNMPPYLILNYIIKH